MNELPIIRFEEHQTFFQQKFADLPDVHKALLNEEFEFWFDRYANFRCFCTVGEFLKYQETGQVRNWIYDRKLETVFINFGVAGHPGFIACLYTLHNMVKGRPFPIIKGEDNPREFPLNYANFRYDNIQDIAAEWIDEHMGFYVSSVAKTVYKDKEMKLNHQERIQFAAWEKGDF